MTDKAWLFVIGFVVLSGIIAHVITFQVLFRAHSRLTEMEISLTEIKEDRDLYRRIKREEAFSRTFCINGKDTACGMLAPVKER